MIRVLLLILVVLATAGCSTAVTGSAGAPTAAVEPSSTLEASGGPEELTSPEGQPTPRVLGTGDSALTEVLPGVWVQGPELDCANGCATWKAAVQDELEREIPGFPAISSMRLFRAPSHSATDPLRLCQSTADLHIAIVSAPGRPDTAVTVFYDAAANLIAIPFTPVCGPDESPDA